MRLERAVAAYLTECILDLHAFKDEVAFTTAGHPYPYFLIDRISTRQKAVGTGIWDRITSVRSAGIATKAVWVHQVLRLTIRAANTAQKNGNAVVGELCDQIETLLNGLCQQNPADLPDPQGGTLHLERVIFQNRHDLAPLEKGLPFVYQQALSFLFIEQRVIAKAINSTLDKISISYMD